MNNSSTKCNVAILAGGVGSRLRERSGDLPKPMVSVVGKPVLQHQIELCRRHGFCNIALLVQHRHEKISEYFGDGASLGVSLTYIIEDEPRGTSGALRDALPMLAERFLVLYGDTFVDVDLLSMWTYHEDSGAVATLLLHPNDHPQDSDLVDIDDQGNVRAILKYPHPPGLEVRNLVNAALYVLENAGLEDVTFAQGKADIAKDMFPRMLGLGRRLYGYVTPEYIKDMGTPERLDKVERDFHSGLPERLSSRRLRSAVFLDRDGTLIREVGHLASPDSVDMLPGTPASLRRLNRSGTLAVVVTNQPVVARGDVTVEGLALIHARFESQLGAEGAFIDGLYFCPHHPDKGFPGEIPDLKGPCLCRKPQPGLIEQACRDLGVDRRSSWIVGDTTADIEAGRRAGIRNILVRTGYAGTDAKQIIRPDYICSDLPEAVEWILNGHAIMARKMARIAAAVTSDKRLVLIGGLARAGKSSAAQVLKELMTFLGRETHVISLDSWLKAKDKRSEGIGVCERYDLKAASAAILTVVRSSAREVLQERLYDRGALLSKKMVIEHSIGPEDLIIVEGVPALLIDDLNNLLNTIKIYIDISNEVRIERLHTEYTLRGQNIEKYAPLINAREQDETPIVAQSRNVADFVVD